MQRFHYSWGIFKQSWNVLRENPSLNWFPVISSLVSLLVTASFWTPVVLWYMSHKDAVKQLTESDQAKFQPGHYALIFGFYICTYFVVNFFNSALVYCAKEALDGRKPTVGEGLHAAASRVGSILMWSLLSATVGTVLQFVSEKAGLVGRIATGILGTAWNILTFFTIPVLIIEGKGPIDSVKGSWDVIKRAWGEALIINAGISSATGILFLVPVVPFVALCFTQNPVIIISALVVTVIYWVLLSIVSATLNGIFKTAVYAYARSGQVAPAYSAEYIQNAFLPKGTKGVSPMAHSGYDNDNVYRR